MAAFSKRHRRALKEGSLRVDLEVIVRGRINRLFLRHNQEYRATDETGWNYETDTIGDLVEELEDLYGSERLPHAEEAGLSGFVEQAPAELVFDAVELFAAQMRDGADFIVELNALLGEEEVPWRMLDKEIVLLDETFARSQLTARADQSVRQAGFNGANLELRRARHHVVDGDGRAAVHRAGSAFESVMMALLDADRGKGARLLQKLNQEGFFDDLPVKLRQPFIREVLQSLPWMRNELGAHGQGESEIEVPNSYAQLATDLASTFCHFLIALKLEQEGKGAPPPTEEPSPPVTAANEAQNLPDFDFSYSSASDDDIPF